MHRKTRFRAMFCEVLDRRWCTFSRPLMTGIRKRTSGTRLW